MITLLAGASVLSLVACVPKPYERQSKPKDNNIINCEKRKEGCRSTGYYQGVGGMLE